MRWLHWTLRTLWIMAVQLVLVLLLLLTWLSATEHAPRWLWAQFGDQLPELSIGHIEGRLLSGLRLGEVAWRDDSLLLTVDALDLVWLPADLLQGSLDLKRLQAGRIDIRALVPSPDKAPAPLALPSVSLPFSWQLRDVRVDRFSWQGYDAEPLQLSDLVLRAQGAGERIDVQQLALTYDGLQAELSGQISLQDQYPLDVRLVLDSALIPWQQQEINVSGDLSALLLQAQGPETWPLQLQLTLNLIPVDPDFSLALSWPRWVPPGQTDWRLSPGSLQAAGQLSAATGELDLALELLADSSLSWPADWPRQAALSGPWHWQQQADHFRAGIDWQGRFGRMPWLVQAQLDSQQPAQARLDMQLADARLRVTGLPEAGTRLSLQVPRLQRFQSAVGGLLDLQASWRGLLDGEGRVTVRVDGLTQNGEPLLQQARLGFEGSLARHQLGLLAVHEQARVDLMLAGGVASTDDPVWRGRLLKGDVRLQALGQWLLREPAEMSMSAQAQRLSTQCWRQSERKLCLQADLLPEAWRAQAELAVPGQGKGRLVFRRDPRQPSPPLDLTLTLEQLQLSALPVSLPAGMELKGVLAGTVDVRGELEAPLLDGRLSLNEGALAFREYGIDWPTIAADIDLQDDKARWQLDLADSAQGTARITGEARLRADWQAKMAISGDRLAAGFRRVARVQLSPDLQIEAAPSGIRVRGEVRVPQGRITLADLESAAAKPSDDVVIVVDRDGRDPRQQGTPLEALPLDLFVAVILGNDVRITGMGLNTRLEGRLELTQQAETFLAANGELRLGEGAVFEAYGQRLQIRTGRFQFAGPLGRPNVFLEAVRTVNGTTVGLRVSGQPPTPAAELFADEAMSQEEMLSYLVLGRSLQNAGTPTAAEQQALALSAALKLSGRTGVLDRFGSRLGISDLTLATEGSADQTQVAVTGQIGTRLQLSVGMGVFEPSQSLRVRYQLTPRLSLEALSAVESAITLFYTFRR